MDLSGENLHVPLNADTYALCWRRIYIGVMIETEQSLAEVNYINNIAFNEVTLDCGGKFNLGI